MVNDEKNALTISCRSAIDKKWEVEDNLVSLSSQTGKSLVVVLTRIIANNSSQMWFLDSKARLIHKQEIANFELIQENKMKENKNYIQENGQGNKERAILYHPKRKKNLQKNVLL